MKSISGFCGKCSIGYVLLLCGALVSLGACTTNSLEQVVRTDGETTQISASAKAEEPFHDQPVLSALKITKIMSGFVWRYHNATLTGVIRYLPDGRLVYYVDKTGRGMGRWRTEDGALCELFEPSVAIPKGWPERCNKIVKTGDTYQVGNTSFVRVGDTPKRQNWNQ
jgi:hypothetical protein